MAKGYSAQQKRAYYSGLGYRLGYEKRAITFRSPENRRSFSDGYNASGRVIAKSPKKYPKIRKKKGGTK